MSKCSPRGVLTSAQVMRQTAQRSFTRAATGVAAYWHWSVPMAGCRSDWCRVKVNCKNLRGHRSSNLSDRLLEVDETKYTNRVFIGRLRATSIGEINEKTLVDRVAVGRSGAALGVPQKTQCD